MDDASAVAAAKAVGVDVDGDGVEPTWGHALYECYDQKVEEQMVQPTFITMHLVDVSTLAKRSPKDPRLTEWFKLFICRREMGNAFAELNDPIDQKEQFEKQVELRAKRNDEVGMMDTDFINALEYGMPPTGGLGIGRCALLITGCDSIRGVILFPTMKPLDRPGMKYRKRYLCIAKVPFAGPSFGVGIFINCAEAVTVVPGISMGQDTNKNKHMVA